MKDVDLKYLLFYFISIMIRNRLVLPIAQFHISSEYGFRDLDNEHHTGIDLVSSNPNVRAVMDGTVKLFPNGILSNYGNTIVIKHSDTLYSLYAHLKIFLVENNSKVLAGDIIGKKGTTAGNKENPNKKVKEHLHFEFLNKWPPDGKDLNRINPHTIYAGMLDETKNKEV